MSLPFGKLIQVRMQTSSVLQVKRPVQAMGPCLSTIAEIGMAAEEIDSWIAPNKAAVEPSARFWEDITSDVNVDSAMPRPNSAIAIPAAIPGNPSCVVAAARVITAPIIMQPTPIQVSRLRPKRVISLAASMAPNRMAQPVKPNKVPKDCTVRP